MKDSIVSIDGIAHKSIVDIRFHKGVNEHGDAFVKCIIEEDKAEEILNLKAEATWVTIKIGEEGETKANTPVFSGVISELSVGNVRGVTEVEMKLVGGSYLMDVQPVTRTFQEDESKLSKIVESIKNKNDKTISGASTNINYGEKCDKTKMPDKKLLVQYQETDYEFLKRCASMQGLPLITSINSTNAAAININIGLMQGGSSGEIESKYYKKGKQVSDFINAKKRGLKNVSEDDYSIVEVRAREYFDIGECVKIAGKTLYVYSVDSVYDSSLNQTGNGSNINKDEFWHTYILADKKRFREATIYNYDMIGASLQANVKEVEKDKVKVDTVADDENDSKAKDNVAFPFATVYSTNDGTGWYCMPEKEDTVRLYFPTEFEDDAYVISAVHLEEKNGLRDEPEKKFIMNKYKKMVEFSKDSIRITNNEGMEIKLDDSKGISIISDKDISLSAEKEVNIVSNKDEVNVSGKSSVTLKQGTSAYVELKGKATVKATSVHI